MDISISNMSVGYKEDNWNLAAGQDLMASWRVVLSTSETKGEISKLCMDGGLGRCKVCVNSASCTGYVTHF
jgi:hypothetical protein